MVVRPRRPGRQHVQTPVRDRLPLLLQRGHLPTVGGVRDLRLPGKILTQIAEMPDGRDYFWVSRTVERRATRYGQPGKTFAIGLGCELRHAGRVIYSDGLGSARRPASPRSAPAARVCERANCTQRAFPPSRLDAAHQRTPQQRLPA